MKSQPFVDSAWSPYSSQNTHNIPEYDSIQKHESALLELGNRQNETNHQLAELTSFLRDRFQQPSAVSSVQDPAAQTAPPPAPTSQAPIQSTSSDCPLPSLPRFDGDPRKFRGFLMQCNIQFNHTPHRFLLAIKLVLEEWRHWLEGAEHPVVVWTDHKNLAYLQSARRLNPRQSRWSLFFSRFNLSISFRPGSKNIKPDALSRLYSPDDSEKLPAPILPPS
uniref:Reverse transcriptase RNase H-like domain-containing protein n=1 Tax=Poecilia mexicana TaxID=48701 RepID=A0A3B3YQE9_9TELE